MYSVLFSVECDAMADRSHTVKRLMLLAEDQHELNTRITTLSDADHQAIVNVITKIENVNIQHKNQQTKQHASIPPTQTASATTNYQKGPAPFGKKYSFEKGPAPFTRDVSPKGYQSVAFKPVSFSPGKPNDTPPPPLEPSYSSTTTPSRKGPPAAADLPSPPPLGPVSPPSAVFPPLPDPPASPDLPPPPPPLAEAGIEPVRPPPSVDDIDITVNISGPDFQKLFPKEKVDQVLPGSRDSFVMVGGKRIPTQSFRCSSADCGKNLADSGYIEDNGRLLCPDCYQKIVTTGICGKCNKPCKGDVLLAIGKQFHPSCFVCHKCGQRFGDKTFHMENGEPYCEKDWLEDFASKCHSCNKRIGSGMQWFVVQNKGFHAECFRCAVCNRSLENQQFFMKQERLLCYAHASGH